MELVLDLLGWALMLVGGAFCLLAGIGILRLPDFYTRIHAAGMGDTLGAPCILLGCALTSGFDLVTAKLLLIIGFLWLSSAITSHSLVKAALAQGLKPLLADDPGARSPRDATEEPTFSR